jgi:ribosomal-protein-serine acetyltransferase
VLSFWIDERCFLRLPEEADANELYAVVDDNREYLARWMPWAANQTLEATLEFIRDSRKQLADNQGLRGGDRRRRPDRRHPGVLPR